MKNSPNKQACFAEIVESNLTSFTAQSWQWDKFPEFGSLVTVETEKRTLFGIVHQIQTGSMEPGRYPFTYQKTQEELQAEQPQIFEFLKTTFSCLIVGFSEHELLHYQIAPEPAKIHSFVGPTTAAQTKQFFALNSYLHLLFSAPGVEQLDELLLALLQTAQSQKLLSPDKLETFIETFSLLIGNDYRRLKLFTSRIHS